MTVPTPPPETAPETRMGDVLINNTRAWIEAQDELVAIREAGERLVSATRALTYAWETDASPKVMWDRWQRAQDAMSAWAALRVPDDTGETQ